MRGKRRGLPEASAQLLAQCPGFPRESATSRRRGKNPTRPRPRGGWGRLRGWSTAGLPAVKPLGGLSAQRALGESKAGEAQSRGPGTVPGLGQRASPSILGLIGLAVETSGARRVVFELGKLEGALPPPAGCITARGARGDGCLWLCRCRVRFTRPKAAIQFPSQSLWIRGAFRRVGRLVSARVAWRHPYSLKWPWR